MLKTHIEKKRATPYTCKDVINYWQRIFTTIRSTFALSVIIYRSMVWKLQYRKLGKVHERALNKITFKETLGKFEESKFKENPVNAHQKIYSGLAPEKYKAKMELSFEFMGAIFIERKIPYRMGCYDNSSLWYIGDR